MPGCGGSFLSPVSRCFTADLQLAPGAVRLLWTNVNRQTPILRRNLPLNTTLSLNCLLAQPLALLLIPIESLHSLAVHLCAAILIH